MATRGTSPQTRTLPDVSPPASPPPVSGDDGSRPGTTLSSPGRFRRQQNNSPGQPTKGKPGYRRKMVCNWAGAMGQSVLLSIAGTDAEPVRPPYNVTVRYDLRSLGIQAQSADQPFLAALDVEKLRRKGSGCGLDVLQASVSWIARDCICTRSGKLKAITAWTAPGELKLSLNPNVQSDQGEVVVMFRVVLVKTALKDPHDWRAAGAPLVLRLALGGKLMQQGVLEQHSQWATSRAHSTDQEDLADVGRPEFWGIRLQQVFDFHNEIRDDLAHYCSTHMQCMDGSLEGHHHVCMQDPCPFRPIDKNKYDDHRGIPVVRAAVLLVPGQDIQLLPVVPDLRVVANRYLRPMCRSTRRSAALTLNERQPLKCTTFVSHNWSEPFADLLETLDHALDRREVVFLAAFSLNLQDTPEPRLEAGVIDCLSLPSFRALSQCSKLVVAVDKELEYFGRLWCSLEMAKAREWHIPVLFWPNKGADLATLEDAISQLDIQRTQLTDTGREADTRLTLEQSLDCFELQPEIRSTWESDASRFTTASRNTRLQRFVADGLSCLANSLERLVEHSDYSAEQLRQLHSEHERKVCVENLASSHQARAMAVNAELEDMRGRLHHFEDVLPKQLKKLEETLEEVKMDCQEKLEEMAAQQVAKMAIKDMDMKRVQAALEREQATQEQLCQQVADLQERLAKAEQESREHKRLLDEESQLHRTAQQDLHKAKSSLAEELESRAALETERSALQERMEEYESKLQDAELNHQKTKDALRGQTLELTALKEENDRLASVKVVNSPTKHSLTSDEPMVRRDATEDDAREKESNSSSPSRDQARTSSITRGVTDLGSRVVGAGGGAVGVAAGAVGGLASGAVSAVSSVGGGLFSSGGRLFGTSSPVGGRRPSLVNSSGTGNGTTPPPAVPESEEEDEGHHPPVPAISFHSTSSAPIKPVKSVSALSGSAAAGTSSLPVRSA